MTLKGKLALFNTILISIVVGLLLFFMITISDSVVDTSSKMQLKYILEENAEDIEWDDGKLELDDIDFYENHVTTLIYSEKGHIVAGEIPHQEIYDQYPLSHGKYTTVHFDGVDYLLYDLLVESKKHENLFLRGIVSLTEMGDTVSLLFYLTLFSLPFFILFTGFGSYFIAKKSLTPLKKIIKTAQDITHGDDLSQRIDIGKGKDEIHQLAETFDDMFAQLEQAFLTEKQFSSDISHELRTPIAVILAECDCNLKENASLSEKTEALEIIQRQGLKMQHLISALLNFIRLDNGVYKLEKEEVDFSELISLVCQEQRSLLPPDRELICDTPENIFYSLDYSLMIRVLTNLIDNGFQYGTEDSWVKVSLREEGENITLMVEDNGIGIDAEHQELIFHRFFQVESARNNRSSMGLGLSMVAQIVKLHNGTISVESTLGKGSAFLLSFPKNSSEKKE